MFTCTHSWSYFVCVWLYCQAACGFNGNYKINFLARNTSNSNGLYITNHTAPLVIHCNFFILIYDCPKIAPCALYCSWTSRWCLVYIYRTCLIRILFFMLMWIDILLMLVFNWQCNRFPLLFEIVFCFSDSLMVPRVIWALSVQ